MSSRFERGALKRPVYAVLLAMAVQFPACHSIPSNKLADFKGLAFAQAQLSLGDESQYEFRIVQVKSDESNRLAIVYDKVGRLDGKSRGVFLRLSTDSGASFAPECPSRGGAQLVPGGLAVVSPEPSSGAGLNLFYSRSNDNGVTWSERSQINDEQGSYISAWGGGVSLAQPTTDDVYCLWPDRRRGFTSLFCSASHDGGRTWSPNQPVEYDFREGEQTSPRLLVGAHGRLIAIWVDWRDRQTLGDIRSSYSDDGGVHWSPSQKLNDDREHVWQVFPSVAARGDQVYVAFQDFREPGEETDNDWNIYFVSSTDNGRNWSRNVPVDVTPGTDENPKLTVAEGGLVVCGWKTSRRSIFGDAAVSWSTDSGRSWSPSILPSSRPESARREFLSLAAVGRRILCLLREQDFTSVNDRIVWLEPSAQPIEAGQGADYSAVTNEQLDYRPGTVIFSDDFSTEEASPWQTQGGVWMNADGAYRGVEPSLNRPFAAVAPIKEIERYEVRGRFKLDPVSHHHADVYFRWHPEAVKYYVISNRFRVGSWLSLNETGAVDLARSGELIGQPLAEQRYPFQNNRWYQFNLIVTPVGVDYLVDGRLMLSYRGRLRLPVGRLGIGGISASPTSFDDIVVSEIR